LFQCARRLGIVRNALPHRGSFVIGQEPVLQFPQLLGEVVVGLFVRCSFVVISFHGPLCLRQYLSEFGER
jgi:hypothetical protein